MSKPVSAAPSNEWISVLSAAALITISITQFAYAGLAAFAAWGVSALDSFWRAIKGIFVSLQSPMSDSSIPPDPEAVAYVNSALTISALAFLLATAAVSGAILAMRRRPRAMYFSGAMVVLSGILAYQHFAVEWRNAAGIYALLSGFFAVVLAGQRYLQKADTMHLAVAAVQNDGE